MENPPTSLNRFLKILPFLTLIGAGILLSSCATRGAGGGMGNVGANHPAVLKRNEQISAEPTGDYWIGRRWWTEGTRFWGYLRKPRQPWASSKLVIFNEHSKHQPDRMNEGGGPGHSHGFDHNYEYRIFGHFSGHKVYDPNSNLMLPEFVLTNYELISSQPGFLFQPGERYSPKRLPPKFPPIPR